MLNPKEWGDETAVVLASDVDIQIIPAFGEVTIIKSSSESSNKQLFSLFHFSEVISFNQQDLAGLELTEETIRDVQIVVTDGR